MNHPLANCFYCYMEKQQVLCHVKFMQCIAINKVVTSNKKTLQESISCKASFKEYKNKYKY